MDKNWTTSVRRRGANQPAQASTTLRGGNFDRARAGGDARTCMHAKRNTTLLVLTGRRNNARIYGAAAAAFEPRNRDEYNRRAKLRVENFRACTYGRVASARSRRAFACPRTYQVATRVRTMPAPVRLGSGVEAQVPAQMGTDVGLKVAVGVAATVGPRFLGVYGVLVPGPVPAELIHNWA